MPLSSSLVRITPFHGGNASSNLVRGRNHPGGTSSPRASPLPHPSGRSGAQTVLGPLPPPSGRAGAHTVQGPLPHPSGRSGAQTVLGPLPHPSGRAGAQPPPRAGPARGGGGEAPVHWADGCHPPHRPGRGRRATRVHAQACQISFNWLEQLICNQQVVSSSLTFGLHPSGSLRQRSWPSCPLPPPSSGPPSACAPAGRWLLPPRAASGGQGAAFTDRIPPSPRGQEAVGAMAGGDPPHAIAPRARPPRRGRMASIRPGAGEGAQRRAGAPASRACWYTKNMYLLIIFLPLLSFTVAAFFGRYIGRNGSTVITTTCIFLTAILSTFAFYEVAIAETNCHIEITT